MRALAALALLASCSRTEPTSRVAADPPRAPAAASSSAPIAAAPPPPAPSAPPPPAPPPPSPDTAWTDDAVVAELEKDCAYTPPDHDSANPSELSCASGLFGQSCVADPCFDEDQKDCKPKCEKECTGCAATCTKACASCKKACKDADCTHACAKTCGTCRQACLTAKDRCSTGTCGAAYSACSKRLVVQWNASGCKKGCAAYNACFADCTADAQDSIPCLDKCRKPLLRVCPAPLAHMCVFNGGGPEDVPP